MSELIGTDRNLSADAEATLNALAGALIPASVEHDVPGADDPAIFAQIRIAAGSFLEPVQEGLRNLDGLAAATGFSGLDQTARLAGAEQFRTAHPELAGLVISLICQCYYRDERVLKSLGMAPRPPFPEGFEVEDGDWSLLDPVRSRGPIYRAVP